MTRFFVINVSDLTNDIVEKSMHSNNPYFLRKSLDGTKVILKCHCDSVSVDLFKLGVVPLESKDALDYINDPVNGFTEATELTI